MMKEYDAELSKLMTSNDINAIQNKNRIEAEKMAQKKAVSSFRIDTHHDNRYMRNLIRQFNFTLCGIVQVRDGIRMAYEKIIL